MSGDHHTEAWGGCQQQQSYMRSVCAAAGGCFWFIGSIFV